MWHPSVRAHPSARANKPRCEVLGSEQGVDLDRRGASGCPDPLRVVCSGRDRYLEPLLSAGSVVQVRIPARCLRVLGGAGGVEVREESLEMQPRVVVGVDEVVAELIFIA